MSDLKTICPICGQKIAYPQESEGQVIACPVCGSKMILQSAKPVTEANPPPKPAAGRLKFCRDCGHTVSEDAVECPSCGLPTRHRTITSKEIIISAAGVVMAAAFLALLPKISDWFGNRHREKTIERQVSSATPPDPINPSEIGMKRFYPPLTAAERSTASQLLARMIVQRDDLEGSRILIHPRDNGTRSISLFIVARKEQEPRLLIWLSYQGKDWVFADQVKVKADDQLFTIATAGFKSKYTGEGKYREQTVLEAEYHLPMLMALMRAKAATIRFDGSAGRVDNSVPELDRSMLTETMAVYRLILHNPDQPKLR